MDFKKFISPSITPSSPGYIILKGFRGTFRGYELTSIRMQDAETIMKWRNDTILKTGVIEMAVDKIQPSKLDYGESAEYVLMIAINALKI